MILCSILPNILICIPRINTPLVRRHLHTRTQLLLRELDIISHFT